MNYLFIGVQGSGKGTQAKIVSKNLKMPHISTGDLLRATTGTLREEVDYYILKGNLVPDSLILKILIERLLQEDCQNGFILDGYPRNIQQAKDLDAAKIKIDNAFNIEISDAEALKRIRGRWSCKKCGAGYNYFTAPKPKQEGVCDVCGGPLSQRADDSSDDAINQRLKTYHDEIGPVMKFYNTTKINGEQPIEKVNQDIEKAIKWMRMFK
jgi:adenylate kinase